ncbi:MAG: hypothetical protein NTW19_14605 [Planctomycetota bacterium]|nr:hypothetical protein [Planctomycetota bacterium]
MAMKSRKLGVFALCAAMALPGCSRSSDESASPGVPGAHKPDSLPVPTQPSTRGWVTCVISGGPGRVDSSEIVVTFSNTTDAPLRLLRQNLLMEEQMTNSWFTVRRNGVKVQYIGRLVKRGPYRPDEYVILEPGRQIQSAVRLSKWYAIADPGPYDCTYRSFDRIENQERLYEMVSNTFAFTMK